MTKEDTQQPFAVLGAAWLWHGGTITVQDTPTNVIKPGEAATIWLEIGHHGRVNQARLIYTTDGTEPEGHQDEVENGKLVTLELERTEPTSSGYAMWWRGTIPPQPQGTPVRYKLYAWHSNGGPLLYAESPTGKAVYTSQTATTFGYYVSDIAPPAWVKDAIIYQVLIDRFFDADPNRNIDTPPSGDGSPERRLFGWNGGDLAGIEARLDYLKYLGINTLWLSPIYENPASQIGSEYDTVAEVIKNYHGYEAVDMNAVEDNFGTLKDFKRLVEAAHAAGIRIILDFVANHTSNQHPHFKDASDRCQDSPYYNWYKFGKVDHQGKLVRYESACCTPGHNHWWGDNDEYVTFFGVKEMPQLDNDYGPTRQAMLEQALKWIQLYG
ncbi:MAG: hypothetical protein JW981_05690, partial [Anaerolineae bacterium]|nr:hypothetical protein [Anaerolineae bacterium]